MVVLGNKEHIKHGSIDSTYDNIGVCRALIRQLAIAKAEFNFPSYQNELKDPKENKITTAQ